MCKVEKPMFTLRGDDRRRGGSLPVTLEEGASTTIGNQVAIFCDDSCHAASAGGYAGKEGQL